MNDIMTTVAPQPGDVSVANPAQRPSLTPTPTTVELDRLVAGPSPKWRRWSRAVRPYLIAADMAAITVALAFVPTAPILTMLGTYLGAFIVLMAMGTYRSRLTLSALDDVPVLVGAALVGGFTAVALHTIGGTQVHARLFVQSLAVATALILVRAVAYWLVRQARRRGLVEHRTLVLGAGDTGHQLAETMLAHPEFGLRPVGFLDTDAVDDCDVALGELPVPLLGRYEDLARCARREGVSEVVIAFGAGEGALGDARQATMKTALAECNRLNVEIFFAPRFPELQRSSRDQDELWGIPLVRVPRAPWLSDSRHVKRAFDVLASGFTLLLLAPLMLLVALAVRIENGPGVLFRQVRVGIDGVPFTILKFRSVRPADLGMSDDKPRFSVNGDPNLGRFSRLMRRASIDELPQLINVLRGDMSIVGPRPEREVFVEEFSASIPRYAERHRVPVGLTGWAQVNGLRGNTSIAERARFDNYYIQNWSLWFDFKIMLRTVVAVVAAQGS